MDEIERPMRKMELWRATAELWIRHNNSPASHTTRIVQFVAVDYTEALALLDSALRAGGYTKYFVGTLLILERVEEYVYVEDHVDHVPALAITDTNLVA